MVSMGVEPVFHFLMSRYTNVLGVRCYLKSRALKEETKTESKKWEILVENSKKRVTPKRALREKYRVALPSRCESLS